MGKLTKRTNGKLADEQEILENKTELVRECFIYFLIKGKKIVYIGSTTVGLPRVYAHEKTKDFDYYTYIPCKKEGILDLEDEYIIKYNPIYNHKLNTEKYISKSNHNVTSIMTGRLITYIVTKCNIDNINYDPTKTNVYHKEQIFKAFKDCVKNKLAIMSSNGKYDIVVASKRRALGYE